MRQGYDYKSRKDEIKLSIIKGVCADKHREEKNLQLNSRQNTRKMSRLKVLGGLGGGTHGAGPTYSLGHEVGEEHSSKSTWTRGEKKESLLE